MSWVGIGIAREWRRMGGQGEGLPGEEWDGEQISFWRLEDG